MLDSLGLHRWALSTHEARHNPAVAITFFHARRISLNEGHADRPPIETVDSILHEAAHIRAGTPDHDECWRAQFCLIARRYGFTVRNQTTTGDADGEGAR